MNHLLDGIAHVAFRAKPAGFYTGILGYHEAFRFRVGRGKPESASFKINDWQFGRLDNGAASWPDDWLVELAFRTTNIQTLQRRRMLRSECRASNQTSYAGERNA